MMKVLICLFAIVAVVVAEKRSIFERCRTDADCGSERCCVNGGLFKFCSDQLEEGDLCTIRSKLMCGCKDGLECQRAGLLLRQCVRVSGSGFGPSE